MYQPPQLPSPAELQIPLADNRPSVSSLSQADEAAAVVAGYRALHTDNELTKHAPGSAGWRERVAAVLGVVAETWGITGPQLCQAVGRTIE